MPKVSVLVPIYNVERYLGQCLASAAAQTLTDIEVLCINDGSTDSSRAIIERQCAADLRFRLIDKPNSGYGASMNRGLDEARGEWVAILESDDFFEPDALERLVGAAEAAGAPVAKANFWFYWSAPQERRELHEIVEPALDGRALCPRTQHHELFFKKPSIWSAVYKRDFLTGNAIRFLETPGASYQDTSFGFKAFACADAVALLAGPVLSYRQDNESSSVNAPGKVFCVCEEYAEIGRFLDARPQLRAQLAGVVERMQYDAYMWNYTRLSDELKPQFLERARQEFGAWVEAGAFDFTYFDVVKRTELQVMLADPERFVRSRLTLDANGNALSRKHYYDLGGPALVAKLAVAGVARRLGLGR